MKDSEKWDEIHKRLHSEADKHSKYAEQVEKLFPRSSIIAEVGGGTGNDALYFLEQGHSVVLIDISKFALDAAQKKAKKNGLESKLIPKKVDLGLEKLPLKNDSTDVAYSRISLNYFDTERTIIIFHDIYRSLKKGGKAFLSFKSPADKAEMELLEETATEFEPNVYIQGGQLRSRFSVEQLESMLDSAGIKEFEVNAVEEELPEIQGLHPILHINEVRFTKK